MRQSPKKSEDDFDEEIKEEHVGETEFFNDTFNKTSEPAFANNEIGDIMKALGQIRYDNALNHDPEVLDNVDDVVPDISPENKEKLEETNKSLSKMLNGIKDVDE